MGEDSLEKHDTSNTTQTQHKHSTSKSRSIPSFKLLRGHNGWLYLRWLVSKSSPKQEQTSTEIETNININSRTHTNRRTMTMRRSIIQLRKSKSTSEHKEKEKEDNKAATALAEGSPSQSHNVINIQKKKKEKYVLIPSHGDGIRNENTNRKSKSKSNSKSTSTSKGTSTTTLIPGPCPSLSLPTLALTPTLSLPTPIPPPPPCLLDSPQIVHERVLDHRRKQKQKQKQKQKSWSSKINFQSKSEPGTADTCTVGKNINIHKMAWAFNSSKRFSSRTTCSDLATTKHSNVNLRPRTGVIRSTPAPPSHLYTGVGVDLDAEVDVDMDENASITDWSFGSRYPTPKAQSKVHSHSHETHTHTPKHSRVQMLQECKLQRNETVRHDNTSSFDDGERDGHGHDPQSRSSPSSDIPYALPCSIEFLSLMLPRERIHDDEEEEQDYEHDYDSKLKLQQERNALDLYVQQSKSHQSQVQSHPYSYARCLSKSMTTNSTSHSISTATSTCTPSPSSVTSSECGEEMSYASVKSGQTALAKDRVQETIASMANIDYYFHHKHERPRPIQIGNTGTDTGIGSSKSSRSPRGVDDYDDFDNADTRRNGSRNTKVDTNGNGNSELDDMNVNMDMDVHMDTRTIPVNVDFVLESSEEQLASFAHSCISSGFYRDAIDIYDTILHHYSNKYSYQCGRSTNNANSNHRYHSHPLVVDTLHNLGVVHTWNGNYNKALEYAKEALKLRRERKWKQKRNQMRQEERANARDSKAKANNDGYDSTDMEADVAIAQSLSELGIIFYAKEDFNKALGAMREALQIYSKVGNANANSAAKGNGSSSEGTRDEHTYTRTHTHFHTYLSPQSAEYKIASTLNNIGCIHFSMGKLAASLSTFEECLELLRGTMGSCVGDDVDRILFHMSIAQCNAATVAEKQGDMDAAASWMEEGLMVQQSVLPDDHRMVTTVSRTLSRLEGKEEDVLEVQDKCHYGRSHERLDIEIECGPDQGQAPIACVSDITHRHANTEHMNLFCEEMLSFGGLKQESEMNGEKMVQMQMNVSHLPQALLAEGKSKRHCSWVDIRNLRNHNDTGADFDFLCICKKAAHYVECDDVNKAVKLFNDIHRSHKNKCGDVSYILGAISHILGIVYMYTGQYSLALKSFKDAVRIRSSALDPDHDDLLASHTMTAIAMIAISEFDNALEKLQTVLHLTRKKYGYSDKRAAVILNNIGICHFELGGILAASKSLEEAIEMLRDTATTNHAHTHAMDATQLIQVSILIGRCLNNLAFLRSKRREYSEAIVALEEALKVQRRIFGKNHPVARGTVESLATCMAIANCQKNKDKHDHLTQMYMNMFDA